MNIPEITSPIEDLIPDYFDRKDRRILWDMDEHGLTPEQAIEAEKGRSALIEHTMRIAALYDRFGGSLRPKYTPEGQFRLELVVDPVLVLQELCPDLMNWIVASPRQD